MENTDVKKSTITLKEGSSEHTFALFPDAESAFIWATKANKSKPTPTKYPNLDNVVMGQHEFIEVEWMGCEYDYDYDNSRPIKLDYVRLVKAHQPQNASGLVCSIHIGWVLHGTFRFNEFVEGDVLTSPLQPENARISMEEMFEYVDDSDVDYDDDDATEEEINVTRDDDYEEEDE